IRSNACDECQLIILGNKVDLEDFRQISKERAKSYAASVGAKYFEVSSVTGVGYYKRSMVNGYVRISLSNCYY
ncbi:hypothetical protein NPIL_701401, partial [Nephila pilipes]